MNNESPKIIEEENLDTPTISRRGFLKAMGAVAALAAIGLDTAPAAEVRSKKEGSPFDPEVQRQALEFVAKVMKVTIDAGVAPLPEVVMAESVSDEDFHRMIGFDTESKRQNLFFPPNTVLLQGSSKMHNLVHEYVHYVQYNYKDLKDGTTDEVEDQAVVIQNLFREGGADAHELF